MIGKESDIPFSAPATAVVDSQLRFLGSVWTGYGVILWWASDDLRGRQVHLALFGGTMVVGGVERMMSAYQHGFGAVWVQGAMWVELMVHPYSI